MTAKRIYIGLWGALIVMTWLQFGGNAVYVPAHARPPILARMLGLVGLGNDGMTIGAGAQGSAITQVNRPKREPNGFRPTSGERRRATSMLGSGLAVNAGYYVAHAELERTDGGVEGGDHPGDS
jgi:hypothetical protein